MSLAAIATIAGGAAALGGAIYGGVRSGHFNNKAINLIQSQRDKNQNWWDVKRSEDYTQRADVQAAITKQRQLLNEQYKRAKATNAVAGGTDESLAMQKNAANSALSQTTADIAAAGIQNKDRAEARYLAQDNALNQQQVEVNQQQAKQVAEAASQVVNAGVNTLGYGVSELVKENELAPKTTASPTANSAYNRMQYGPGVNKSV